MSLQCEILIMVYKGTKQLSRQRYEHYISAYVKLERLEDSQPRITSICGVRIYADGNTKFQKGRKHNEIAIDHKIVRINLISNSLNLKITPDLASKFPKRARMYNNNDSLNRSILKQGKENECNTPKSVSFNNTFYITPISPRRHEKSPTPVKDYEFAYKEYLKSVQMNGSYLTNAQEKPASVASPINNTNNNSTDTIKIENNGVFEDEDEEYTEVEYLEEPKKRRGRPPKGTVSTSTVYRPPASPPKKRGWPLGLSRKAYRIQQQQAMKMKAIKYTGKRRGRPKKIIAFGFQSIVSDIKTVTLPNDLWSAHVSVTAKKSQVCFTRVVQAVSNSVPVECDRSVKFNGTVNYLVRINNRDVELIAAPPTVNSLRDVEILLEIVNEIGINDPILEYNNR